MTLGRSAFNMLTTRGCWRSEHIKEFYLHFSYFSLLLCQKKIICCIWTFIKSVWRTFLLNKLCNAPYSLIKIYKPSCYTTINAGFQKYQTFVIVTPKKAYATKCVQELIYQMWSKSCVMCLNHSEIVLCWPAAEEDPAGLRRCLFSLHEKILKAEIQGVNVFPPSVEFIVGEERF